MQALTLCESVFRAKLQNLNPRPLKSLNSSLCASLSPKKSKLSHQNPRLGSSIYSNPQIQQGNADEDLLWKCSRFSSAGIRSYELRVHEDKGSTSQSLTEIGPRSKEAYLFTSLEHVAVPASGASFHSWLKLAVLVGLLTFQGTQQAVAGSDFATGMQSIPYVGDLGDISTGFASAFLLIFFSELGDKTFFIAALLAARNSGAVVFIGTFGALASMTIISVILGRTFHYVDDILPVRLNETDLPIDDIAAVCLLVYFGVSTLIEATSGDGLKAEEEQKEAELAVSEFSGNGDGLLAAANTVISTFALVFVAEWGDKSFFSTIALAAASSPLGVIGGALAGHAVATLLAVVGGSLLGTFFSEKVIAYVGGSLFLVFAAATLIEIVN